MVGGEVVVSGLVSADDVAASKNDSSSIAATARPWWLGEVSLDRGRGAPVVDLSKLNMRKQV